MSLPLILALLLLIGLYVWLRRQRPVLRGRSPSRDSQSALKTASTSVRTQTQRQLLRLVHGNRAVAQRLVHQIRLQNPGRSEQWCWEKAIYDIQRDRRA